MACRYNTFVAMKVQKSAQNYLEAAYDEVSANNREIKTTRP